MKLIYFFKITF